MNDTVYVKDPYSSEAGRSIMKSGPALILKMGTEAFTFRKLARYIGLTEGAVYRYFENKHKFLIYLMSWYWGWMEHQLVYELSNINSPEEKLDKALSLLVEGSRYNRNKFMDIPALSIIAVNESAKAYLTKAVKEEDRAGMFANYKSFIVRISAIVSELNPKYKYPGSLMSTVVESTMQQRFFKEHIPGLSDFSKDRGSEADFYATLILNTVKNG